MNRLRSPEFWIGIACALGAIGVLLIVIAMVTNVRMLGAIGLILIAPLVIIGVGLVLVVIPTLVLANRKHNQKNPRGGPVER